MLSDALASKDLCALSCATKRTTSASHAADMHKRQSIDLCGDAADSAAGAGAQPSYEGKSEYYTQDEMAAMFKPKKKKVAAQHSPLSGSCMHYSTDRQAYMLSAPVIDSWCWLRLPYAKDLTL